MESSSSFNVNDLPAAERQTLERMLGQPLSPDQRVLITAYTPRRRSEESMDAEAGEDRNRIFEKIDQYVFDHGVLPKEAEAAIEEALRRRSPGSRNDRHRRPNRRHTNHGLRCADLCWPAPIGHRRKSRS